jgi:hypothetical protein
MIAVGANRFECSRSRCLEQQPTNFLLDLRIVAQSLGKLGDDANTRLTKFLGEVIPCGERCDGSCRRRRERSLGHRLRR